MNIQFNMNIHFIMGKKLKIRVLDVSFDVSFDVISQIKRNSGMGDLMEQILNSTKGKPVADKDNWSRYVRNRNYVGMEELFQKDNEIIFVPIVRAQLETNEFSKPAAYMFTVEMHPGVYFGTNRGSALFYAACVCDFELVDWLLDHNASLNTEQLVTPLMAAIASTNPEKYKMVEYLINRKADVNVGITIGGNESPITTAFCTGDIDIMELLLKNGADLHKKGRFLAMQNSWAKVKNIPINCFSDIPLMLACVMDYKIEKNPKIRQMKKQIFELFVQYANANDSLKKFDDEFIHVDNIIRDDRNRPVNTNLMGYCITSGLYDLCEILVKQNEKVYRSFNKYASAINTIKNKNDHERYAKLLGSS